jgi:hypothetical protein
LDLICVPRLFCWCCLWIWASLGGSFIWSAADLCLLSSQSRSLLAAGQFPFYFWRSSLLQSMYSVPAFRSLVSTRTGVRFAPAVHVRTVFQRWPSLRFLRERCLGRACLRGRRAFSLPAHNRRKLQASTCGPARHLCAFDFVSAPGSGTWPVCLLALWLPYVLIKEHSHQLILILILHSSVRL